LERTAARRIGTTRAIPHLLAQILSLLAVLGLLIAPSLHGGLSHAHDDCRGAQLPLQVCLDSREAPQLAVKGPDSCAICIAASQARGAAPAQRASVETPAPAATDRVAAKAHSAHPPLPVLARSAPRAPPAA
jgi:hypothetical protein